MNIHKKPDINILFCALIAFLLKYRPKDEQHFTSIAKLLATFADCNNIPPHVQTVLDRIFNEIEQNDPESIASRQYKMFKAIEPSLAKKQINELLNLLLLYTTDDLEEFIKYDTVQINELCDKNSKIAIFAIAPINETLSPLYETFKYQLYKVLKEDYLKNNLNIYNKSIDNFLNERKKFRKITYLTLEEVTNLISSLEIQIKRLEMSRHIKDTKINIESINKEIKLLNEKIYEYGELEYLLILKKLQDIRRNK